ncbi:aminodeoxychorismate lyase [Brevibacillus daliensis]|uniref:aminodeoxychorismate lyase n=1 Tax=Brevibacillus daliensis TaxID=2892995 RepID=UPI001E6541D0|nr:aminodeoxychorismate lyase [Brevibacillus daliensis]
MWIYANNELVPAEKATVPAMDHGFLYGIGLFETIRVYNGRLFLWEEHATRLQDGLTSLNIRSKWTTHELQEAIMLTLERNDLQDAYVRLSITAGDQGVGLHADEYKNPLLYIFVKPVTPIRVPPVAKRLQVISFPRQSKEGLKRFKSHNYLNCLLAKQEIGADPHVEGLFLTTEGHVCEGVVSNIFWVENKSLYTPSEKTPLLAGITRKTVITLAKQRGIDVKEGYFSLESLYQADEVFVTNSIQELVPVSYVEDQPVKQVYGETTSLLHEAYRALIHSS